jgi:hypothetical protein
MRKKINCSKMRYILVLAFVIFSLPATLWADQTLTFEGFAPYTVLTTQYPGINFQGATVLTLGAGLNPQFPPHSGVNVVYNPSGPMQLVFSNPIAYFSGYLTYNSGMNIQAFDIFNNLLGTVNGAYSSNYVGTGNPPNELLTITAPDITKVVLSGGGGNNFTLDDVRFTGSQSVPLPAGILLLGPGLAGLAALRRRFMK